MSRRWPGVYVIGLTGNIATGKSAVMQSLRRRGAVTIDADQVVHELMRPGTAVYDHILAAFGSHLTRSDGEIDRARLGAIVFADPQALRRLEAILHPAVGAELDQRIAAVQQSALTPNPSPVASAGTGREAVSVLEGVGGEGLSSFPSGFNRPVIVVEAIKLIESGLAAAGDTVWVVTAPFAAQMQRMMVNRCLSEAEARLRIQAQPPAAEKVAVADVVLDNQGSLEDLEAQIESAWRRAMREANEAT